MTPRPAALPDWTPTVAGFYRSIKVPMHDGSYEWTKAQAQAFFARAATKWKRSVAAVS